MFRSRYLYTLQLLFAAAGLLSAGESRKAVGRDAPCVPATIELVIAVVSTSSGLAPLTVTSTTTTTVVQSLGTTSPASLASITAAGPNPDTGAGENPCGTVISYSLRVETVGPTDTQTVYDTVTITVPAVTSTPISTSGTGSSTTTSSLETRSSVIASFNTTSSTSSSVIAILNMTTSSEISPTTTSSIVIPSSNTTSSVVFIFSNATSTSVVFSSMTTTSRTTATSQTSSRSSSSTPCIEVPTPCVVPNTFYLQATGISSTGSAGTNTLLPRANCQYATLYDAADGYPDDFLTFSLPGRDNATAFTLDSQSRLVGANNSYIMNVYKMGSSNQAYFTAPDTFATYTHYGATNCSISTSDCSLSCAYGAQTYMSLCFGSTGSAVDANGHLYMTSNVANQGNNCRAVKPIAVAAGVS